MCKSSRGGGKSALNKGRLGFTFVEVILVMAILSFLYIVTTKVIQHNLEKKVPTYVYYLYKNLENQNKWLLEKIKKDNPDKNAEDVIASMDAKSYCETFAKDINTRGKNNCAMLDDAGDQEIVYNCNRTFNHVVNSDGSFSATYNPTLKENESISDYNYCDEIKNLNNFTCRYKPKKVFNELAIPNTDEQLYNCTTSSVENIEIDNRNPLNIKTHFKSTNNIYFNILKFKAHKYNFTLNATQGDICKANFANGGSGWDNLKDKIIIYDATSSSEVKGYHISYCKDAMNLWNDPTNENYNFSNKTNISCCGTTKNKSKLYLGLLTPPINGKSIITLPNGRSYTKTSSTTKDYKVQNSSKRMTFYWFYYRPSNGRNTAIVDEAHHSYQPQKSSGTSWTYYRKKSEYRNLASALASAPLNLTSDSPLKVYANAAFAYNYSPLTSKRIDVANVAYRRFRYYYQFGNMSDYLNSPCQTYLNFLKKAIDYKVWENKTFETNPQVVSSTFENVDTFKFQNSIIFKANNDTALKNSLVNQYNKWTNYFKQSGQKVEAKKALSNKIYNENDSFNYEKNNHIIYVSIDTPFEKGEMNKNIFAFEQFEDRIIPVGYLANNSNTPLKFDVITRNPKTFKIEKVNYYEGMEKRPLTFCEAMSYTGEEFSPYCGCRWPSSGVLVTGPNGKGNPTYYRENGDGYPQKIKLCDNNFGCIIRPVKPSSGGWF